MEKAMKVGEDRFFSESKKGINYAVIIVVGIALLLMVLIVTQIALVIAVILILAEVSFGPLKLVVFEVDVTPLISWLTDYKWFIISLATAGFIYTWLIYVDNKKVQAENRYASKILEDEKAKSLS